MWQKQQFLRIFAWYLEIAKDDKHYHKMCTPSGALTSHRILLPPLPGITALHMAMAVKICAFLYQSSNEKKTPSGS